MRFFNKKIIALGKLEIGATVEKITIDRVLAAFRAYQLADALELLSSLTGFAQSKQAVLEQLKKDFPQADYPKERWNTSAVPLEEQTALFRAIEHTLNILGDWPCLRIPEADYNWAQKSKMISYGEMFLQSAMADLFPLKTMPSAQKISSVIDDLQPLILARNRGDDLSRAPQENHERAHYLVDDRFGYMAQQGKSKDIGILTDNVGGETFAVLLEAWLLLQSGKNLTIYAKQEPTLFSDVTVPDLMSALTKFDKYLIDWFGLNVPKLSDYLNADLQIKELPYPYLYTGQLNERGEKVVTYDFVFVARHDMAIFQGELQYGDYFREQLRAVNQTDDPVHWKGISELNPYQTTLVFRKANKNHRELVVGVTDNTWQPHSTTRGEFVHQVLLPR